jgi:ribosomal peptide maturation radical SAM protein 1
MPLGGCRTESVGFGINLLSGDDEFACLILIDGEGWWARMVTTPEHRAERPAMAAVAAHVPAADLAVGDRRHGRLALVNMPFTSAERPSIQCGLLKAVMRRAGHAVDVHYLSLEAAAAIGAGAYAKICDLRADQFVGDWLFTVAAFGYRPDEDEYRRACARLDETLADLGMSFAELCELRNRRIPALVARWTGAIDWGRYDAVGFSSTFEQNVASLALARAIKASFPRVATIFGGANLEGEMGREYVRALDGIDFAVTGEGELALPRLFAAVLDGGPAASIPGVAWRRDGRVVDGGPCPRVERMDELPDPDYDDYFATLSRLGAERVLGRARPILPFESARGCWWGEKHHCTFCGLNASGMAYRSKSAERTLAELGRLTQRYDVWRFEAVDNIMDMRYVDAFAGRIAERRHDLHLFYEVKANLTRKQLKTLALGGLRLMQPGIESLSTHVLGLMRKGTTRLINLRLLKWALYYGIHVNWNLLAGFPGETAADYESQTRLIPSLHHLPPPGKVERIWLERFSPYFSDPSFPVSNVRPWGSYRFVYPVEDLDLASVAYFFDYDMAGTAPAEAVAGLAAAVDAWRERWRQEPTPQLRYARAPGCLKIFDRREATARTWRVEGDEALLYEACSETFHSAAKLAEATGLGAAAVDAALERFCAAGVVAEDDGRYLALALPTSRAW